MLPVEDASLGGHVHLDETSNQWEITFFRSRTSIVGGSRDGRRRVSRFHLDLAGLLDVFDHVRRTAWQTHPLDEDDELGSHVAIEGVFAGHDVWVRILAEPPERFESGWTPRTRFEEKW